MREEINCRYVEDAKKNQRSHDADQARLLEYARPGDFDHREWVPAMKGAETLLLVM